MRAITRKVRCAYRRVQYSIIQSPNRGDRWREPVGHNRTGNRPNYHSRGAYSIQQGTISKIKTTTKGTTTISTTTTLISGLELEEQAREGRRLLHKSVSRSERPRLRKPLPMGRFHRRRVRRRGKAPFGRWGKDGFRVFWQREAHCFHGVVEETLHFQVLRALFLECSSVMLD